MRVTIILLLILAWIISFRGMVLATQDRIGEMVIKNEYNKEIGIRLVRGFKERPALIIGLWNWTMRIEL